MNCTAASLIRGRKATINERIILCKASELRMQADLDVLLLTPTTDGKTGRLCCFADLQLFDYLLIASLPHRSQNCLLSIQLV